MASKKLSLSDVECPICLSLMIKPVSLPCKHGLCLDCFVLHVSNVSLTCPICRKRLSTWYRKKSRDLNLLVDQNKWEDIKSNFPNEVFRRLNGLDESLTQGNQHVPSPVKISKPGEIRMEYLEQLERVKQEEEALRQKQELKSLNLIQKLQEEENRHGHHSQEIESIALAHQLQRQEDSYQRSCTRDEGPSQAMDVTSSSTRSCTASDSSSNGSFSDFVSLDGTFSVMSSSRSGGSNSSLSPFSSDDSTTTSESDNSSFMSAFLGRNSAEERLRKKQEEEDFKLAQRLHKQLNGKPRVDRSLMSPNPYPLRHRTTVRRLRSHH